MGTESRRDQTEDIETGTDIDDNRID